MIPTTKKIGIGRRLALALLVLFGSTAALRAEPLVLSDVVGVAHATAHIVHRNAAGEVLWEGDSKPNLLIKAGLDYTFDTTYDDAAKSANYGLSYIALSNDTVGETADSTTLSSEIAANGLSRALGTYAHTPGAATCTIAKTFTATGTQSCQKAALFSYSSGGAMHHVLSFTQRNLVLNDTITITFTITLQAV